MIASASATRRMRACGSRRVREPGAPSARRSSPRSAHARGVADRSPVSRPRRDRSATTTARSSCCSPTSLGVTALVDEIAARRTATPTRRKRQCSVRSSSRTRPRSSAAESIAAARQRRAALTCAGAVLDESGNRNRRRGASTCGAPTARGSYDSQYPSARVDCRGRIRTAADGTFAFRTDMPVKAIRFRPTGPSARC